MGYRDISPIIENSMEEGMQHQMETGLERDISGFASPPET